MIKLDTKNWKVETDCKTVGEFMTEAVELSGGNITIIVDGCRYEFHDNPKIMVTDDTPLECVAVERADSLLSGVTVLRVTTAPKPKTVRKSMWGNLYKTGLGNYFIIGKMYGKENECYTDPTRKEVIVNADFVTTAKIEWEEVVK